MRASDLPRSLRPLHPPAPVPRAAATRSAATPSARRADIRPSRPRLPPPPLTPSLLPCPRLASSPRACPDSRHPLAPHRPLRSFIPRSPTTALSHPPPFTHLFRASGISSSRARPFVRCRAPAPPPPSRGRLCCPYTFRATHPRRHVLPCRLALPPLPAPRLSARTRPSIAATSVSRRLSQASPAPLPAAPPSLHFDPSRASLPPARRALLSCLAYPLVSAHSPTPRATRPPRSAPHAALSHLARAPTRLPRAGLTPPHTALLLRTVCPSSAFSRHLGRSRGVHAPPPAAVLAWSSTLPLCTALGTRRPPGSSRPRLASLGLRPRHRTPSPAPLRTASCPVTPSPSLTRLSYSLYTSS